MQRRLFSKNEYATICVGTFLRGVVGLVAACSRYWVIHTELQKVSFLNIINKYILYSVYIYIQPEEISQATKKQELLVALRGLSLMGLLLDGFVALLVCRLSGFVAL